MQVSTDCTSITWQKAGDEGGTGEYDEIKVSDITEILRGMQTNAFRRMGSKKADPNFCFSVVSSHRTLDLVSSSEQERDLWVDSLQAVAKFGSGYGGLEATKKALEERGEVLMRTLEKTSRLKDAAETYRDNTHSVLEKR